MLSQKVGSLVALLRRLAAELLILVSLFCIPLVSASEGERNVEEITGVVVAYDNVKPSVTCIEVCQSSLIVRIGTANEAKPRYIRVDLTFPNHRFPKELIKSKRQWKFKLIRTPHLDERIDEFIRGEDVFGKEFRLPIWRIVTGAEDEKLPFSEVLPSYSLVKNSFKFIPD